MKEFVWQLDRIARGCRCISGHTVQDADPLGKGDKFCQGLDLHFFHQPVAMGLDRAFGPAYRAGNLLVGVAPNDEFEDLPLARRQCRDMSANQIQLDLPATRYFMMRYSPLNCPEKVIRRYGFGQKILRTRLDGPHSGRNIGVASEKQNGERRAEVV
jgi:hypothetical protein